MLSLHPVVIGSLIVLFLLISVFMVLVVLVQKPQGGGLAGAFGGTAASSGQTAFGAKTGDALTVLTIAIFVVYVLGAVVLNWVAKPSTAPPPNPTLTTGDPPAQGNPAQGNPAQGNPAPASSGATPPSNPASEPAGPAAPPADGAPPAPAPQTPAPPAPATEPKR